jgi:hypothetical protein
VIHPIRKETNMATDNVTPVHPSASEPDDAFDGIYDQMQEQLDTLRCVLGIIEATDYEHDDKLTAAVVTFCRTYRRLDELHSAFADWHMATSAEVRL